MLSVLILLSAIQIVATYDVPSSTGELVDLQSNRIVANNTITAAACRDADLARFMNAAMGRYIHDMGALSKDILDQIVAYRKPGAWLVHTQIISGQLQGRDWQSVTNGEVFSGRSLYSCFYHDMQTYILVIRLF
ncbi:unnamed protein product [Cylicocyclus nassatus]|uniref:Uncharacterized protein n=1 Tax=Cylicocyclus nassatus TaxID=53992 RepID=A0AA36HDD2_CYLNA|nr:unnamed protein product [Cylicocyclus nassatus]